MTKASPVASLVFREESDNQEAYAQSLQSDRECQEMIALLRSCPISDLEHVQTVYSDYFQRCQQQNSQHIIREQLDQIYSISQITMRILDIMYCLQSRKQAEAESN